MTHIHRNPLFTVTCKFISETEGETPEDWGYSSIGQVLASSHETLGLTLRAALNASVNRGTWEVEAGGSQVQGHPQLHNEFEASLAYLKTKHKALTSPRFHFPNEHHLCFLSLLLSVKLFAHVPTTHSLPAGVPDHR